MSQNSLFPIVEYKTMPAGQAKNSFGQLIDDAQRAPVVIEKHGRPYAVMVAAADFLAVQQSKEQMQPAA